ncbi:MAG: hypothetical protein GYA73_03870, partial [Planctomycetes bacterium]|nr:hypothetical protein [Planctomycetota bacterium]
GWPYELVLEGLAASDDLSARGAATVLVAAYDRRYLGDETLAAVDLAAASEAVSAFDLMLAAVLGTGGAEALVDVAEACLASSPFDYYGYWDFGGLLENLAERASEKPWGSLAGAALAAYRGAVTTLAEHVWPPATGLTIYLPPPGHRPFASYNASTLRFAADTLWPAVLAELAGLPLVDDAFAPNATPATAKEIACGVEYRLRLLGHYDYFRFTASETGRFTAVLRNFPEYADLDLSLLDENGRLLADAATGSATEVVSWSGPAEAKYYLRVEWYDGPPSPYTLEVRTNVDAPEYIVAEGDEAFVSTTGGAILPIAEDDGGLRVELPFQFKFFGREYAAVNVSSNGFLSFGRGVSAYNSMPLPMPGPPTGIVAVWWADLQPRAGTRIIASAEGAAPERAFTITWSNIGIWGSSTEGTITFQASLYEDTNAIVFRYLDTLTGSERDDFGASAAVGLQAEGSHSAVLYSFREPVLRNGLSLRFMPVRGLFVRGDASRDGRVDVGDAVTVLSQVFLNAPVKCADASDANDDGVINIADAIRLLGRLFADGPPLPPPYPEPGTDPTPDGLDCADA